MKSAKEWLSALDIREEDFASWARMAPSQDSLTFWCIDTGKIDGSQYINWARDHFGLASVESNFFDTEPNVDFWQKIESVANWSAEMVPVGEWDNTVFIACVEPRSDVRWSFPVRYLLALPTDLKKYWSNLQTTKERSFAGIPSTPDKQVTVPATTITITKTATASNIAAASNVTAAPNVAAAPNIAAAPMPPPARLPSEVEEPAGLNLSAMNLNPAVKERDYLAELANEVKKPGADANFSGPDNLNWQPKAASEAATAPDGIVIDFGGAQNAPPPVNADTLTSGPLELSQETSEPPPPYGGDGPTAAESTGVLVLDVAPSETKVNFELTTSAYSVNVVPLKPSAPPQAAPPEMAPPPVPLATTTAAPPAMRYIRMLPEFKMTFEGGMILEVENDNFTPVCWDEAFKPSSPKAQKVWNLNPPSAFRVAYRTGLPYLGQVIETPLNRDFFTSWGFINLPKIVLVRPMKNGTATTHLIVCVSDGLKKNHLLLSEGDRLADLFSEILNLKMAA